MHALYTWRVVSAYFAAQRLHLQGVFLPAAIVDVAGPCQPAEG